MTYEGSEYFRQRSERELTELSKETVKRKAEMLAFPETPNIKLNLQQEGVLIYPPTPEGQKLHMLKKIITPEIFINGNNNHEKHIGRKKRH
jgi:hypothetical protein